MRRVGWFFLVLIGFAACDPQDCSYNETLPVLQLSLKAIDETQGFPDTVDLGAMPYDTVLTDQSPEVLKVLPEGSDKFALELPPNTDSLCFYFSLRGQGKFDTLCLAYERSAYYFHSQACGMQVRYDSLRVRSQGGNQAVWVENSSVEDGLGAVNLVLLR